MLSEESAKYPSLSGVTLKHCTTICAIFGLLAIFPNALAQSAPTQCSISSENSSYFDYAPYDPGGHIRDRTAGGTTIRRATGDKVQRSFYVATDRAYFHNADRQLYLESHRNFELNLEGLDIPDITSLRVNVMRRAGLPRSSTTSDVSKMLSRTGVLSIGFKIKGRLESLAGGSDFRVWVDFQANADSIGPNGVRLEKWTSPDSDTATFRTPGYINLSNFDAEDAGRRLHASVETDGGGSAFQILNSLAGQTKLRSYQSDNLNLTSPLVGQNAGPLRLIVFQGSGEKQRAFAIHIGGFMSDDEYANSVLDLAGAWRVGVKLAGDLISGRCRA